MEPQIKINGVFLSPAQAMAVRVAVTSMLSEMTVPAALGDDELGTVMAAAYAARAREVLKLMAPVPATTPAGDRDG